MIRILQSIQMFITLACLLFLFPSCLSQSVSISISPDVTYIDSNVTITCIASADSNILPSLVPLYLINGTYVQHSCIGDSEFLPLTQNFFTLPYTPTSDSTLSARISLSPVSASNDGLSIGCAFYNPVDEMLASSELMTLVVPENINPTIIQVNTTDVTITDVPIVNSLGFQIGVGSVGGAVLLLVIIALLLILIVPVVVCLVKNKRRKSDSPARAVALDLSSPTSPLDQATNPVLKQQEPESFYKNVSDSIKAENEKEFADRYTAVTTDPVFANKQAQSDDIIKSIKLENEKEFADRYTALPTYSVVVNADAEREQLSASTDPSIPHQFSSYTCVDSYEPSNRLSGLQYYFTYHSGKVIFTTEVLINSISSLDDGLTLACVFYDLQSQTYYSSRTLNVSIFNPTATSTAAVLIVTNFTAAVLIVTNFTTPQGVSNNFVNSQDFYITVGTFSVVVFGSIILIIILIAILIVCAFKRGKVATHPVAVDWNKYDRYPVRCTEL